jgi:hypothetical protein
VESTVKAPTDSNTAAAMEEAVTDITKRHRHHLNCFKEAFMCLILIQICLQIKAPMRIKKSF